MDNTSETQQPAETKFTRRQVLEGIGLGTAATVAAGTGLFARREHDSPPDQTTFQLTLGNNRFDIRRTYDDSFLKPEPNTGIWSAFASHLPTKEEEKQLLLSLWSAYSGDKIKKPSNDDQNYTFRPLSATDLLLYGTNEPTLVRLKRGRIPFAFAGKGLMNESGQNMLVYVPANTSFEFAGEIDVMQLPPQQEGIDPSALAWGLAIDESRARKDTSLTICQPYRNPADKVKIEPIVAYQIEPAKPISRILGSLGLK